MHMECNQIIFDVQFKDTRAMEIGRYENISRTCFVLSKNQHEKICLECILICLLKS